MNRQQKSAALAAGLAMCAAVVLPARAAERGYSDVQEEAWYAPAVEYCLGAGLMDGTGGGKFSPDGAVTRGMLAAVLYRMAGSPAVSGSAFPDVAADSWYAPAAAWAAGEEVMSGYPDGRFGPNDPATREQVAAVFWRRMGCPTAASADFADEGDISAYASGAVAWVRASGLMRGQPDGRFDPGASLTRAQLAQVLANCGPHLAVEVSAMDVMCQPCGIAAMEDGSLLVSDQYNKVIWRIADGRNDTFAGADTAEDPFGQPVGGYHDGSLRESLFKNPWAIAPFLEGWAVSDPDNGVVRFLRLDSEKARWTEVTDLGVGFDYPTGLAADEEGNLYVSETFKGEIKKITPKGKVTTLARNLTEPMGLCWSGGSLYAAECGGERVIKIGSSGQIAVVAGSGETGSTDGPAARASFSGPKGVAVDGDGTVYVADTGNGTVRRVRDGQVTTVLSRDHRDATQLFPAAPTGLLIHRGTLYITDAFARKLLAYPLY